MEDGWQRIVRGLQENEGVVDGCIKNIRDKFSCDFTRVGAETPWFFVALGGGNLASDVGNAKHVGVCRINSIAATNSGGKISLNQQVLLLSGKETTNIFFKTRGAVTGFLARLGFTNGSDHVQPTNGVYIKILEGVMTGVNVSNNVVVETLTNKTLSVNTWYQIKITINDDATTSTFELFDDSNLLLWSEILSGGIPKITGREVGHGVFATTTGNTSIAMLEIDYIEYVVTGLSARRIIK